MGNTFAGTGQKYYPYLFPLIIKYRVSLRGLLKYKKYLINMAIYTLLIWMDYLHEFKTTEILFGYC